MQNLKNRIQWNFNLGVLFPTVIYFFSLWYYGFLKTDELVESFTTPKFWMLFVIIYFPLLNIFIWRKLKTLSDYLAKPTPEQMPVAQRVIARLPIIFILHVMVYAISGAGSLLLVEDFFTWSERLLGLVLGFAFVFVYALPFFIRTVMLIESWTVSVPLSEQYRFLSVKAKLYFSLFCNVLGVAIVVGLLNVGVVMTNYGVADLRTLLYTLLTKNLVIGFLCLAIVIINLLMLSRQLTKPLTDTTQMFQVISRGDLTRKIDIASKDEMGVLKQWIDIFVDTIHDVIARVRQGAGYLDTSSKHLVQSIDTIASSMNDMTDAATKIAISSEDTCKTVSEVVDSLENMNVSIANVATHATHASEQSKTTVEVTNHGKQVVAETIQEMDFIRQEMDRIVQTIERVGGSIQQVERVVNIISGIARQTNMLAINASIEAARVGEAGRGFGVVAESISQLSDESKRSTEEITALVAEIRTIVQNSVDTTKESVQKVESGVTLVRKTHDAFDQIYGAINSTTALVNEIAVATDQQAQQSKSIMDSVKKVNEMSMHVSALVQEQVAATEEVAATLDMLNSSSSDSTSQKLAEESRALFQLISQFQVAATRDGQK